MLKKQIFDGFIELGNQLGNEQNKLPFKTAVKENPWFISPFLRLSVQGIVNYLDPAKMEHWISRYDIPAKSKTVGVIMAGNIPAVGFHDLLCCLIAGHKVKVKLSSKDTVLTQFIVRKLFKIDPVFEKRISMVSKMTDCDAYIATGSNNTARYFEFEFRNKPSLIRKNRTSIGILSGEEKSDDLNNLADDIFQYFGLGCRNISTLLVPAGYRVNKLAPYFKKYNDLSSYTSYMNNLKYSRSVFRLDKKPFYDFNNLLMAKDDSIISPIGVVHYWTYRDFREVKDRLKINMGKIQSIFASIRQPGIKSNLFGSSQTPELWDYSDGVDTLSFLTSL